MLAILATRAVIMDLNMFTQRSGLNPAHSRRPPFTAFKALRTVEGLLEVQEQEVSWLLGGVQVADLF